jgi:hypothetical protein
MENEHSAREDLGYRNTPANTQKYHLNRGLRMQHAPGSLPEPSALCRIRLHNGDVKKLAWEYAEFLINHRGAEFLEWV